MERDISEIFNLANTIINSDELNKFPTRFFYTLRPNFTNDEKKAVVISSAHNINKYYNSINLKSVGSSKVILLDEVLNNAKVYGGSKLGHVTYLGLFMNWEKFCFGCNDGGDYFKNKHIKHIWENRLNLYDTKSGGGHPFGYSYFKSNLDDIIIDDIQGTFYGAEDIDLFSENFPRSN